MGDEDSEAFGELLRPWASCLLETTYLQCRKRRAVENEDFTIAVAAKSAEPAVSSRLSTARQRALSAGANRKDWEDLFQRKLKAVADEDFKTAADLKRKQAALEELDPEETLTAMRERKRRAVESEDFSLAADLKLQEKQLCASKDLLSQRATLAALTLARKRKLPAGGADGIDRLPASLLPPEGDAGDSLWSAVTDMLTAAASKSTT